MLSILRILITCITCIVVFSNFSYSASGNQLAIGDKCTPSNENFKKVDEIVSKHANYKCKETQYYFLGQDFYLADCPAIYIINTKTGVALRYGYEYPDLKVIKGKDGSVHFLIYSASMRNGNVWAGSDIIHLRYNQIINCPYLVKQNISSMIDASEELHAFCADPENKKDSACSDKKKWGKTKFNLTDADINRIINNNSLSPERSERLWSTYEKALKLYKKTKDSSEAINILENAGIINILDSNPQNYSQQQYITILNDYAFFKRDLLAVEILDKVIKMSPNRKAAYLNMSESLDTVVELIKMGYGEMPLDKDTIEKAKELSSKYLEKYKTMK